MPRYFFNTRIGDELISDPDGEVLSDPDRAWEMARAMIRELLRTEGADGALLNATIEVTDDEGEIVLEFPFAEAILDAPGPAPSPGIDGARRWRTPCPCHSSHASGPAAMFPIAHRQKISETAVRESHRRRHHACLREEIRLPRRRTP